MNYSKNYFLLALFLLSGLLNSCENPDDITWSLNDPDYVNQKFFSPPSWILGRWESEPEGHAELKVVFEFTADNIIDPIYGNRNEGINNHKRLRLDATVEETESETMYTAVINWGVDPFRYRFDKIDEITIVVIRGYSNGQIELHKME